MDEIATFVRMQPTRTFTKDSILVYQGELPHALYVIRSGFVKMFDLSADGSEQMVGLAGKTDLIPSELLFLQRTAAQFFYSAFTTVEVHVVDRLEFITRVRNDSDALFRIAQVVSEKYLSLRRHLTAVQKPRAREKIVHVLHFLASYFADDTTAAGQAQTMSVSRWQSEKPHKVSIPLTQQDIANLVGITRETAAHELKQLKAEGYISYSKAVFFINRSLEQLII